MALVDPFDQPTTTDAPTPNTGLGAPRLGPRSQPSAEAAQPQRAGLVDPYDEAPPDFSKVGEFDARNATEGQKWRLALGYLTTPSLEARADIIREVLPGARIDRDPEGRPIVSYKGEVGYIDKPGVTVGVMDTLAQVGKYIPAGKIASIGGNVLARVGLGAAAAGATSVAEDVAAIPQGSRQGVDPIRAGTTAAGGAAGEVLAPVIGRGVSWLSDKGVKAWRALRSSPGAVGPQGTLTERGAQLAREMGFDPDQITKQLATELESSASQATRAGLPEGSEAAARQALSQRFKVPLTKGELTQDYAQQSLEENLRRMDVTTRAGQVMRGAEQDAASALRGESGDSGFGLLTREINPRPVADVAEAGQTVIHDMRTAANQAKNAYQGAYRTARDAGAALSSKSYNAFLDSAEGVLKDSVDYDPQLMPKTAAMLNNLRQRTVWMTEMGGNAPKEIPLAKLENMRKIINAAWKSADATDRIGLDVLRGQYDEMVNGALDAGRVSGDPQAIEAWQLGRKLFARYRDLYTPGNAAGQAEKRAGQTVENWLKSESAAGEDAIRMAVFNPALAKRIVDIQGVDSPAHAALKQGVLEYVFRPALKGDGVSPQAVKSRFEQYFRGQYRENMGAIFSKQDLAAISEFYQLALAKIPQPGVVNYSNSANTFMKALQQLGQKLGVAAGVTGNIPAAAALSGAGALGRARAASQARDAARGLLPRPRAIGVGTTTGAAASAAGVREYGSNAFADPNAAGNALAMPPSERDKRIPIR